MEYLPLAQALEADSMLGQRIYEALSANPPETAAAEIAILTREMRQETLAKPAPPAPQMLRDGLRYQETAKGDIVLSGAVAADPAFRAGLQAYLAKTDPK